MQEAPRNQDLSFYSAAFGAGILGALVITIAGAIVRAIRLTSWNTEMTLGSMVTQSNGLGSWLLGFIWHLLNGGIFALIYAAGFKTVGRSGAVMGLAFGFIHWIVAGLIAGVVPAIHPMIPERLPAPGLFLFNLGWAPYLGTLLLHLAYGMIVGSVCQASMETAGIAEPPESETREVA